MSSLKRKSYFSKTDIMTDFDMYNGKMPKKSLYERRNVNTVWKSKHMRSINSLCGFAVVISFCAANAISLPCRYCFFFSNRCACCHGDCGNHIYQYLPCGDDCLDGRYCPFNDGHITIKAKYEDIFKLEHNDKIIALSLMAFQNYTQRFVSSMEYIYPFNLVERIELIVRNYDCFVDQEKSVFHQLLYYGFNITGNPFYKYLFQHSYKLLAQVVSFCL